MTLRPPSSFGTNLEDLVTTARDLVDPDDVKQGATEYGRGVTETVARYMTDQGYVMDPEQARRYVVWWLWGEDESSHHKEIASLRGQAEGRNDRIATRLLAAAALLETHDATGINLCQFGPVEDFVNDVLKVYYHPECRVRDNHV